MEHGKSLREAENTFVASAATKATGGGGFDLSFWDAGRRERAERGEVAGR
jgi:hypothetical protein